jgi:hypothetical protein
MKPIILKLKAFIISALFPLMLSGAEIPTPESHFGFKPGTDRMLFNYQSLIDYFSKLDEISDRFKMIEIGQSPMGKKMHAVFISSEKNIKNLEKLREINRELALNPNLSSSILQKYIDEGKVFILSTLSMHASEVAPAQAIPSFAYEALTTSDVGKQKWFDDVVYMFVPSHNPDGMDLVVNYYNKTKGTKYEGSNLPEVYHKYVGHDNNRDFVTLTQSDNQAVARLYNRTWFPQVMCEKHQMGSTGPRYFVPPMHDPIAENIDEKIWNWTWVFGSNMATDMAAEGHKGISQQYLFDDYWPGSTETALWKNIIGLLTEMASVQGAKPIFIEKSELTVAGKGLSEYKKSINMPAPWEGGWWTLGEMVKYEITSNWSLVKTGSKYRAEILKNRNILCQGEVNKGKTLSPAYYILPANQTDKGELADLLSLLDEHGISVYKAGEKLQYGNKVIAKGDIVVPLAQPFRAFIKEVLEKQNFPARHYTPGGELIQPYDITSWSLPMHRGLVSYQIEKPIAELDSRLEKVSFPLKAISLKSEKSGNFVFPVSNNESFRVVFKALNAGIPVKRAVDNLFSGNVMVKKGDFFIALNDKNREKIQGLFSDLKTQPIISDGIFEKNLIDLKLPRIALMETHFADMDAGWTRYIFDSYSIPFSILKPGETVNKNLTDFDVIVFPDNNLSLLLEGKNKSGDNTYNIPNYDPKYTKGIGKEGVQNLMKFVADGGVIVSWGQSTGLFLGNQTIKISETEKEEFDLPVTDVSKTLAKLSIPGSLLNVELIENHPLTLGMDKTAKVFSRGRPVFNTSIPYFDMDRRVIARYPENEILASGYAENQELLAEKAAMVWIQKGKGQLVMYGFSPQFRASTTGTYKLLFNALLLK